MHARVHSAQVHLHQPWSWVQLGEVQQTQGSRTTHSQPTGLNLGFHMVLPDLAYLHSAGRPFREIFLSESSCFTCSLLFNIHCWYNFLKASLFCCTRTKVLSAFSTFKASWLFLHVFSSLTDISS